METIGKRIKLRRKELGMTQTDLGKACGVTYAAISQWEREETTPASENLFSLSRALKCVPAWLLYGENGLAPPPSSGSNRALDAREEELLDTFAFLTEESKEIFMNDLRMEKLRLERIAKEFTSNVERLNKIKKNNK